MKTRKGWIGEDGIGRIPLTRGKVALVDAALVNELSQWNWSAFPSCDNWYAKRGERPNKTFFLHRHVLGATTGQEVDHKNRNGLDNRRENLRLATSTGNMRNRGLLRNNRSGFKGVRLDITRNKWRAVIWADRRQIWLGRFDSRAEAVAAYDRAAIEMHGEFAVTNATLQAPTASP